ncbi:MAG: cation:proton antiporter [Bryobacteraceae bacterium]
MTIGATFPLLSFFSVSSMPEAVQMPLAMLIIFGTAKLLAELFEAMGQPGIVGEILAGVLIGPSLLNWVQPNDLLKSLAELGVMFLLFRVGLEVKASDLTRVGGTALLVAAVGVAVPLAMGWYILRAWGAPQIEALFVGAAMVATSVGITAQVLTAKGLLWHRASQIIIAAAVIDDVLGLLVLAVVSSLAKGSVDYLQLALTAAVAVGFILLVIRYGTAAMGKIVPKVEATLHAGEVQFNFALLILFALSVVAVFSGVAAIIGAFLAGMTLAETVNRRVHDLASGISELLVPFFLAGIGLHIDLAALADRSTLMLMLIILAAAVLSKLIGCGLGAYSLGKADMLRIGLGMVPRGEVGMVVAQLGLSMGVIAKPIYSVVVCMAVFSTIVAPPLLKFSYRDVKPQGAHDDFRLG